jgi:arylsulfatase A-like enzyme
MRRPLLAAALLCAACAAPAERGTNVLLVTLDTTRADRLGCYGYPRPTSPNIDALAERGVRFEQALSTSAITPIAHATLTLMSGLNPDRHGLRVFWGPAGYRMRDGVPLLAERFRDDGYATAAFVSAYPASQQFGLDRGFTTFDAGIEDGMLGDRPTTKSLRDGFWLDRRNASAQRRADATTDRALAWLDEHDERFFMWVHYFDPHDPSLVPPEETLRAFGVRRTDPNPALAVYDPEVFFMDQQFGRLLDGLRADGRLERTIVVVVADHGQGLGDHGWFPHRLLYQEQIRIPFLLAGPGLPTGVRVPALVRGTDLFPTLAELAGLPLPVNVQGRSLMPLVRGEDDPPRLGYAEALNTLDLRAPVALPPQHRDLLFAVVDWPWKLIHHREHPERSELYDLERDPGELRNLAVEQPVVRARLLAEIERSGMLAIETQEIDAPAPEFLEKLRSLGYVN